MQQNIIEYWREQIVSELFKLNSFKNLWPTWKPQLQYHMTPFNANNVFNSGDYLYDVFKSPGIKGRGQGDLSSSGTAWESLVCWYLNLNLIGRNTIVVKHKKGFIPEPISDAITVKYGTSISNTESDLIAITFPSDSLLSIDKDSITLNDATGAPVVLYKTTRSKYNLKGVIDALANKFFSQLEIHIIQCKTNWNDNAQIPMLWDMVYSAKGFSSSKITVGQAGRLLSYVKRFTYSFVTVPTVEISKIKPTSICVDRVDDLTGGNYWGKPSKSKIADNIKEMLTKNLSTGHVSPILTTLNAEISRSDFSSVYEYFNL